MVYVVVDVGDPKLYNFTGKSTFKFYYWVYYMDYSSDSMSLSYFATEARYYHFPVFSSESSIYGGNK